MTLREVLPVTGVDKQGACAERTAEGGRVNTPVRAPEPKLMGDATVLKCVYVGGLMQNR